MLSEIGVLETEEVEYAVESDGIDALFGIGHNARLGMEGNAQTGLRNHGEVVGTIAHGNGLCEVHFLNLCYELQQFGLSVAVDNLTDIMASQLAVLANLQFVGIDIVDTILTLQVFAEIGESTREDGYLVAAGFEYIHEPVDTLRDGQVFGNVRHPHRCARPVRRYTRSG